MESLKSTPNATERFLKYVAACPASLVRSSFEILDRPGEIAQYPLQSWPAFVDAVESEEHHRIVETLCRKVFALPQDHFGGDPEALAEFFGLELGEAAIADAFLKLPGQLENLLARGDFIEDETGRMQCLELNVSSNLGGWQNGGWADLYRRIPVLQGFWGEGEFAWRCVDTLGRLFEHLIARHFWRCKQQREEVGELNVAFLAPGDNRGRAGWYRVAHAQLERLVDERYPDLGCAAVLGGTLEDLEERGDHLYLGPKRVHVVVEAHGGRLDRRLFASAMAGRTLVVNGPVDRVLANKKCLALLSEQLDSSEVAENPADLLIRAHLPWTRVVSDGYVDYRGQRGFLPEVLEEYREHFVLKPALGMRGEGVEFGRSMSPQEWQQSVEEAVDAPNPGWIVQEVVPALPRIFQLGEQGSAAHDVVWGFFLFGERFGGGFIRMLAQGEYGVVNAARGAQESPIFIGHRKG